MELGGWGDEGHRGTWAVFHSYVACVKYRPHVATEGDEPGSATRSGEDLLFTPLEMMLKILPIKYWQGS